MLKKRCVSLLLSVCLLSCFTASNLTAAETAATDSFEKIPYQAEDFLAGHVQSLYTDQSGLEVNENNDICQTPDGYLWIASYSGLTRFDGRQFEVYNSTSTPQLEATGIVCLSTDSKGQLWIGSNDKGLFRMENDSFTSVGSETLGLSIRRITEAADGTVYVATSKGVGYIGGDGRLLPLNVPEVAQVSVQDLTIDSVGQLWILSTSGDISVLKDNLVVKSIHLDKTLYGSPSSVYADQGGTIFVGTETGYTLPYQADETGIHPLSPIQFDGIQQINSFYRDSDQRLWICADNGLGYLNQQMQYTALQKSLATNSIERIFQDYEGTYWVASSRQGVLKMSDSKFFNLAAASKLPEVVVNGTQTAWGDLYVATDGGLYVLDPNGMPKSSSLTQLLSGVRLRQLYLDSRDRLWISTYQTYGLICAEKDGTYTSYTEENSGLSANTVRCVLERANGDMAVATGRGVNLIRDGRVIDRFGVGDGLENPVILSLCEGENGILYAGSDGSGIYCINTETRQVDILSAADGLSTGVILRMTPDPSGKGLWISTGNQLDYYDFLSQSCGRIPQLEPSRSNIFDIRFLPDGRLLILSARGMAIADVRQFTGFTDSGPSFPVEYFERDTGLSATVTANSWSELTGDGILYLCLNPGINVIDTSQLHFNSRAPKVAINAVLVDNDPKEGSHITVPSTAGRITINLATLSYIDQNRLKITYQLEGFDPEPITMPWAETPSISYTNLPGGSYVFRISAVNGDGIQSAQPAFVTINKEKAISEYPLFTIGIAAACLLLILMFVGIYYNLKTKKLQKRQKEYKAITEQSLRTIANTIDAKDSNTKGHSTRVAGYSLELARRMHLSPQEQENAYYCALLHDIGKIGIPDAILHKPGALTDEEFEIMRSHATIGGDILKDFKSIPNIHIVVESHHENYNGGGYPSGADQKEIPLIAQIIRVADTYDAMDSQRSYRSSMSQQYILSELRRYSGSQFNPQIAQLMIDMVQEGFTVSGEL